MIILKRDGFWKRSSIRNPTTKKFEETYTKIDTENLGLIRAWEESLEIEEDVICSDLFKVLAAMNQNVLFFIEQLTNSNIKPYLTSSLAPLPPDFVDDDQLTSVEIYRVIELTGYDSGEVHLENDYVKAHGVGRPWQHGFEESPMSDEEKVATGCNVYAIEFTPWNQLGHLPLRAKKTAQWTESLWKRNGKGKKREFVKLTNREIEWTPTLREFFCGITSELCFFGDPETQERQSNALRESFRAIELSYGLSTDDRK